MKRYFLGCFGLAIGAAVLAGCAPVVVAIAPPPPPAVAVAAAPAVWVPSATHRAVTVRHVVTRRHWVSRGHSVGWYHSSVVSGCGSDVHPCNPQHITVPIE